VLPTLEVPKRTAFCACEVMGIAATVATAAAAANALKENLMGTASLIGLTDPCRDKPAAAGRVSGEA
jgi:hypothetical protein